MLTLPDIRPIETSTPTQPPALPLPGVSREVDLVISAMEAGGHCQPNRRGQQRNSWRVQATVRLFVDQASRSARTIFTRDIHSRGLGFVTPERLPLGYGGMIDLPAKDGTIVSVACTVLRCRLATPGWYEGLVYFNREQSSVERWVG